MKREKAPSAVIILVSVVLVAVVLLFIGDRALEYLITITITIGLVTLLMWRLRIDSRKDERIIHLMGLSSRNAFFFLLFAMPWLAGFHLLGIITVDAGIALMVLWWVSLGVAWLSFFYYYKR